MRITLDSKTVVPSARSRPGTFLSGLIAAKLAVCSSGYVTILTSMASAIPPGLLSAIHRRTLAALLECTMSKNTGFASGLVPRRR